MNCGECGRPLEKRRTYSYYISEGVLYCGDCMATCIKELEDNRVPTRQLAADMLAELSARVTVKLKPATTDSDRRQLSEDIAAHGPRDVLRRLVRE